MASGQDRPGAAQADLGGVPVGVDESEMSICGEVAVVETVSPQ